MSSAPLRRPRRGPRDRGGRRRRGRRCRCRGRSMSGRLVSSGDGCSGCGQSGCRSLLCRFVDRSPARGRVRAGPAGGAAPRSSGSRMTEAAAELRRAGREHLALHLEHGRQGGDARGAALDERCEGRDRRRVAVAAVALVAHELAVLELDDAALHLVDEAGLVRRHQDRRAAGVDAGEQLHDVDGCRGVEVSRGLVGEQHLRAVHERARERDALLLAAAELVREPLLLALETDEPERLGDGLLDEAAGRADHLERERHVLEDGLRRQQPEVLEHGADVPAEVRHPAVRERAQVAAEHDDPARARACPRGGSGAGTTICPSPTRRRGRRIPRAAPRSRRRRAPAARCRDTSW